MPQRSLGDQSTERTLQNCLFLGSASLRWNRLSRIVTVSRSLELLLTYRQSSFTNQSYFSLVGEENSSNGKERALSGWRARETIPMSERLHDRNGVVDLRVEYYFGREKLLMNKG